jgi:hypothetical protein
MDIKLPDSQQYLDLLERRLQKIRKDNGILQQLTQKREECLAHLLNGDTGRLNSDYDLELNAQVNSIENGVVLDLIRTMRPEQPLSMGEIVHIIEHDQLQENMMALENGIDEHNTGDTTDEGEK